MIYIYTFLKPNYFLILPSFTFLIIYTLITKFFSFQINNLKILILFFFLKKSGLLGLFVKEKTLSLKLREFLFFFLLYHP